MNARLRSGAAPGNEEPHRVWQPGAERSDSVWNGPFCPKVTLASPFILGVCSVTRHWSAETPPQPPPPARNGVTYNCVSKGLPGWVGTTSVTLAHHPGSLVPLKSPFTGDIEPQCKPRLEPRTPRSRVCPPHPSIDLELLGDSLPGPQSLPEPVTGSHVLNSCQ